MYKVLNPFKAISLVLLAMAFTSAGFCQEISDDQIKRDVVDIDSPLKRLLQLEPKIFEYNTQNYKQLDLQQGTQYGFLSDNVQAAFPHLVGVKQVRYMFGKNVYRNAQIKTIDEASLIPVLVASIKEQQQEIEKLKAEVEKLKR